MSTSGILRRPREAARLSLLTDENIAADVVAGLRTRGCDVRSADDERLIGPRDGEVLERAMALNRVIVTHDLAFGKVDIGGGASFVGIVYLRPGHISAAFVLAMIDALRQSSIDVHPPFMVVAERRETSIRVRVRTAPPW